MPAGVVPGGGGGGCTVTGLFPPPQLAISTIRIPANRRGNSFFLDRATITTANGASTNANASPGAPAPGPGTLLFAAGALVFTVTVKLTGDPDSVTDDGLIEQAENRGTSWQPNVSVPLKPNLGVTTRL